MINHHLLRDYQGGRKTDHAEYCYLALFKKTLKIVSLGIRYKFYC